MKAKKPKAERKRRPWLPCPRCQHSVSAVLRVLAGGQRRRQCGGCGLQFTTSETVVGKKVTPVSTDMLPVLESILNAYRNTPHVAG